MPRRIRCAHSRSCRTSRQAPRSRRRPLAPATARASRRWPQGRSWHWRTGQGPRRSPPIWGACDARCTTAR
eukprot:scaffold34965_cov68-Phaeocystis_antarctica.AAC.6